MDSFCSQCLKTIDPYAPGWILWLLSNKVHILYLRTLCCLTLATVCQIPALQRAARRATHHLYELSERSVARPENRRFKTKWDKGEEQSLEENSSKLCSSPLTHFVLSLCVCVYVCVCVCVEILSTAASSRWTFVMFQKSPWQHQASEGRHLVSAPAV